jgi:glycosyltransferase involved in cell wall biosynthesis
VNSSTPDERVRLAIVVSHPIQHFAPWYREVAKLPEIDLKLFYSCDWGSEKYHDPQFGVEIQWDIPLLDGYEYEFLPIKKRPASMTFWELDNPTVTKALSDFDPHVVLVHGYASRTNWRVARWTSSNRKPLLIYSDSNSGESIPAWKRIAKRLVVGYFYGYVDGALYVGNNNCAYHSLYGIPKTRLFPGTLPVDRNALLNAVLDVQAARRRIREELAIPQDAFVVLLCGKLTPGKRPMDLVKALHRCTESKADIWGLIVGDGPERGAVEAYCEQNALKNVRCTGFVNQAQIANYYAAADCIAVTSEKDSHPLVITEAATFGLPVIASDAIGCIGAEDTTRDNENAIVYRCGDIEKLTSALVRFSCDKAFYADASEASLRMSKEQDVTVAAGQLLAAVRGLRTMGVR